MLVECMNSKNGKVFTNKAVGTVYSFTAQPVTSVTMPTELPSSSYVQFSSNRQISLNLTEVPNLQATFLLSYGFCVIQWQVAGK